MKAVGATLGQQANMFGSTIKGRERTQGPKSRFLCRDIPPSLDLRRTWPRMNLVLSVLLREYVTTYDVIYIS